MMTIRMFFALVICALGFVLAGCSSFAPVYGGTAGVSPAAYSFNFAPPRSRLEQIILNQLASAFPAQATASSPTLSVSAAASTTTGPLSKAIDYGRIIGARVTGTVTIGGNGGDFTVTRFTEAGYQPGALVMTDNAALTNAQETAARSTAESLRAAILATYRPVTN